MRLLLVRHGQTYSNLGRNLDTAEPGADLTPLGERQARALPAALAGQGIDAVYVSNLVRTQQTAAPLARALGLTPHVRPGLREISAGELEMADDLPSVRLYVETMLRWAGGDLDARLPGGESGAATLRRFDDVVEEAVASSDVAVLVSHGAMIRAWAGARCEDVTVELAADNPLSNTGAVLLTGTPSRWLLERWHAEALGGELLDDPAHDGPAGEPAPVTAASGSPDPASTTAGTARRG
ncbi:histidine phosphatase family protein [Cellulomonas cellasea]|uniref:Isomerase n=1 Tax=Cellulomonas cellasea TaxID=43670 RepID=A0A4Y3KU25_9CELL|nr:histidine phosphatase family protein [Cellulomonas cellasea]GEA87951.1 isomerase [Cellulomonas cellasea]